MIEAEDFEITVKRGLYSASGIWRPGNEPAKVLYEPAKVLYSLKGEVERMAREDEQYRRVEEDARKLHAEYVEYVGGGETWDSLSPVYRAYYRRLAKRILKCE